MMKVMGNILFKEEQHFRVKWLWWIIALCMLSCIGLTVGLVMTEKEKIIQAWIAVLIVVPLEALIAWLMFITKLVTVITSEGVFYKWFPFQRSFSSFQTGDVERVELRKGPALNYGFHWVPGYGKVHNLGPGKGFQFTLKNGKKIFIGTQKQSAFQHAIDKLTTVPRRV